MDHFTVKLVIVKNRLHNCILKKTIVRKYFNRKSFEDLKRRDLLSIACTNTSIYLS